MLAGLNAKNSLLRKRLIVTNKYYLFKNNRNKFLNNVAKYGYETFNDWEFLNYML